MRVLEGLQPDRVFYYFEEISKIPRGSGNMQGISGYLVQFAREHGLSYIQDEAYNVVIFKEASPGYEDAPGVMLQGHMDMVCAKRPDVAHDFQKDGLRLAVDADGMIHACGTTLGGDDGIAIAYMLAILESSEILHPALEAVLTVDEEIGLLGADALDASQLKSRRLINLDSEEEGILTVGCAGGLNAEIRMPNKWMEAEGIQCTLSVEGCQGGHSGTEIDKGRANAILTAGRALYRLAERAEFGISHIEGGEAHNAIPKSCRVSLLVDESQLEEARDCAAQVEKELRAEYAGVDGEIRLVFSVGEKATGRMLSFQAMEKLLFLLCEIPDGVLRMSPDIPGLVQTSLNLGVIKMNERETYVETSIRSASDSERRTAADRVAYMAEFLGGRCSRTGEYPAWEYRRESALRELMADTYRRMYGQEPQVEIIHAGLECGLIAAKMEDLDCVSIGPDIQDIHTPEERLDSASVRRVWEYLLEVLRQCR